MLTIDLSFVIQVKGCDFEDVTRKYEGLVNSFLFRTDHVHDPKIWQDYEIEINFLRNRLINQHWSFRCFKTKNNALHNIFWGNWKS